MSTAELYFQSLIRQAAPGVELVSPRAVALVFEESISISLRLHPDDAQVLADVWCVDLDTLDEAGRRVMVDALLAFNAAERSCKSWFVALDERGLVVLHARWPMARLEGSALASALAELLDVARRWRRLADTLCIQMRVLFKENDHGIAPSIL